MSAMTPLITVLRAEAQMLTAQAQGAAEIAQIAVDNEHLDSARHSSLVAELLVRMSKAKLEAADQLEAEQRAHTTDLTK
jgi:hypothetical protein